MLHVLALTGAALCALALGFTAHRANICTVRAMAEIISARSAYMLASVGKSILWALLLIVPVVWLVPSAISSASGWELTTTALIGGFIFGLGSTINGGCAFSTMTRMMDGELRMALSIAGFAIGVFAFVTFVDLKLLVPPAHAPAMLGSILSYAWVLILVVLAWALYEIRRLWRIRPKDAPLHQLILLPQYQLSAAALVIGAASTGIFLLVGAPGYTITMQNFVQSTVGTNMLPSPFQGIMMLAVLVGMLVSALQRRSFRLDWQPQVSWLRNFLGGALMGLGTGMLPGGNDALLLSGLPSFSPNAPPAYIALLIGAGIGVLVMKLAGINTNITCRNDIFRNKLQPPGSIVRGHVPQRG
jgi:uncharacterized membrane protein YedE/YeeE